MNRALPLSPHKDTRPPLLTVMGHVGVGHVHGAGGIIQDDSAGFAVVITLMARLLPVDLTVLTVEADHCIGTIRVVTASGGTGEAYPARGFSRYEAEIMRRAVGHDARYCQSVAIKALGRLRGQGADEVPVCLEAALALAVVDSFARRHQDFVLVEPDGLPGCCGRVLGAKILVGGKPVSLVATVNASEGGIGPVEDNEGNLSFAGKRNLLRALYQDTPPAVVVESKAYIPELSADLAFPRLLVRACEKVDNRIVAEVLCNAASSQGFDFMSDLRAYPRGHYLRDARLHLAERLKEQIVLLESSTGSLEKTLIIAELNRLCSEEAGGMSFMSDHVHALAGSGGLLPGSAAVLSLLAPAQSLQDAGVPLLDENDLPLYIDTIDCAVPLLLVRLDSV